MGRLANGSRSVRPYILYLATNYLYRWNDLTQSVEARLGGVSLSKTGWVNGIAVAFADSKRIYTCSNGGEVYVSQDRGSNWRNITANLPRGSFNAISAVNPANADDVLVGVETPSSGGRLWRCTNPTSSGPAWNDVSGSSIGHRLPAAPVHAIVRDPTDPASMWYVATTVGVYQTTTAGSEWKDWWTTLGAPVVEVRNLILVGKRLRAGTYGRGIWEYFPGTLQLFYRGTDSAVWSRWRNADGSWSDEQQIGGDLIGDLIAAVIPGTDVLQLFYRGTDSAVWSHWRNADGSWSEEQRIGGDLIGNPIVAVVPGANILQLFYRGTDSAV